MIRYKVTNKLTKTKKEEEKLIVRKRYDNEDEGEMLRKRRGAITGSPSLLFLLLFNPYNRMSESLLSDLNQRPIHYE